MSTWTPDAQATMLRCLAKVGELRRTAILTGEGVVAAEDSERSLLGVLEMVVKADDVWADNTMPGNLSLGGMLRGGMVFGVIARTQPHGGVQWTVHS